MKTVSRAAIGLALAIGIAGGAHVAPALAQKDKKAEAAPADAPRKYEFSKPVQKLLAEAQKLQQAGDQDGSLAKIREAEAVAQTPDDRYMANALKINIAIAKSDNVLLEEALTRSLDSGQTRQPERLKYQRNLAAMALNRKDMPRAIQLYEQITAENPKDAEAVIGLAEMYNRNGRTADAVKALGKAIDTQRASGAAVPEAWYKRALALAYDAKLTAQVTPASLALVGAYPTATNWRDALVIFRDNAGLDDQGNLDAMRLMHATKSLTGERDYFEYAETANGRGLPGEAKSILDEGIAKGVLAPSKPHIRDLLAITTPKVKSDRASLAGLEKEGRASSTGKLAKATADGYLGYNENAKAADLYKTALQKGGVDAAEVNTRIGIALSRVGDKAGAEAAFKTVTGKRAELAKFWLAYLGQASATTAAGE